MARCEECIHDKVCDEWAVTSGIPFVNADTCDNYKSTADVVEVVRCKDCKFFCENSREKWCASERGLNFIVDNDFCSYGERKE